MEPDSASAPIPQITPQGSRDGKLRLVLQRLAAGYYQRADVMREAVTRILRSP